VNADRGMGPKYRQKVKKSGSGTDCEEVWSGVAAGTVIIMFVIMLTVRS
jgi:hypothetical protein